MRVIAVALLISFGLSASESALAGKTVSGSVGAAVRPAGPAGGGAVRHGYHHHHSRVFVGGAVGFGYPWGWYYPPPYYYYPVAAPEPVTYIEQGAAAEPRWWYYCDSSTSYYPYVKECPAGWQRVAPE
jgi:hypothetical protein